MKSPLRSIHIPHGMTFARKFSPPLGSAYADIPRPDVGETILRLGLAFVAIFSLILAVALLAWDDAPTSRESKGSNTAPSTLNGSPQADQGAAGGRAISTKP